MNSYNRTLFNNNHSSFNITNSNNTNSNITTHNYTTVNDEESRILSWISPLESWKRHSDVVRTRVKGVGEWVLQSSEFSAWKQEGNDRSAGRILFGCGAPGTGKTFICSLVIDTLCDGTTGRNIAVGCLYCDYRGQKEQTPEVMIGSLLRQFVTALSEIPEEIQHAYQVAKTQLGGRAPELAKVIELFPAVLERFQQVFICVDALDEFSVDHRAGFLRSLRHILHESPNARLFLTARPHIQSVVESNIPLDMSIITIQPLFKDIKRYLATKLDNDPFPNAMDDVLRSEILTKILKETSGIFLLVTLQVDSILGEVTIGGRRKKLHEIANDLGDSYAATLERVRGQRGAVARLGILALMWISLAERPLSTDELCQALAVEVGSPDINTAMVPPTETVMASCMGLVTIDHTASTVRLVHATLEEYLRSHQDNVFQSPHATIAEVCLSYLGIPQIWELPSDLRTAPPALPLLTYASCYWGVHARKGLTPSARHLAIRILKQYPGHAAANILLSNGGAPWYWEHSSAGFSGLHCAAYFGIDELLGTLLSMEQVNLNLADEWGRTPLILAAGNGNDGVVRILISRADVNPNSSDFSDQTSLHKASKNGHEGVVKTLLSRADVKPDTPDSSGGTPLSHASANGHEGAVRTLLSRPDVNPNSANWIDETPLFRASSNGHAGVVRILLSRADVNPILPDWRGLMRLFQDSANDHERAARTRINRANFIFNSASFCDETPLIRASANGHEEVVRILLSRADVDPNLAALCGETPLFRASANGHEDVVKTLLNRADINLNPSDKRIPLLTASENGHEGVVGILLIHTDINPNSANRHGQTPLLQASANGHDRVVSTLLSRADINLNLADPYRQTPLFLASANGHEAVVRILLSRADVNPNSEDCYHRTPLFEASASGHEGVVRILLSHPDVDPNLVDIFGITPLCIAASRQHHGIANLLQARN